MNSGLGCGLADYICGDLHLNELPNPDSRDDGRGWNAAALYPHYPLPQLSIKSWVINISLYFESIFQEGSGLLNFFCPMFHKITQRKWQIKILCSTFTSYVSRIVFSCVQHTGMNERTNDFNYFNFWLKKTERKLFSTTFHKWNWNNFVSVSRSTDLFLLILTVSNNSIT